LKIDIYNDDKLQEINQMEEMPIGKKLTIIQRWYEVGKPKQPPLIKLFNGEIKRLLFSVEIEQSSINRKSKVGKNKTTQKSFVYSDPKAVAWHQDCQYKVMEAMKLNNIKADQDGYYAVLILVHCHYKKPTSKKNPKLEISSDIIDVGNLEKNVQDMLQGILYFDDEANMNVESRYSHEVKPYMTKLQTTRKRKNGVMVTNTRNVTIQLATVKVYQVG